MTKLEIAKEAALTEFEKWNEITGVFDKGKASLWTVSYIWEVRGLIEDAAEIGYSMGTGESAKRVVARINKRNFNT